MLQYEQPELPIAEGRPIREVYWCNVTQIEKRLFGRKVLTKLMTDDMLVPKTTAIRVEEIDKLKDPALRYALRFADAADAAGWREAGFGGKSRHSVLVMATDEGFDSRLINAIYTGLSGKGSRDTFMANLYRFEPVHNENYQNNTAN